MITYLLVSRNVLYLKSFEVSRHKDLLIHLHCSYVLLTSCSTDVYLSMQYYTLLYLNPGVTGNILPVLTLPSYIEYQEIFKIAFKLYDVVFDKKTSIHMALHGFFTDLVSLEGIIPSR